MRKGYLWLAAALVSQSLVVPAWAEPSLSGDSSAIAAPNEQTSSRDYYNELRTLYNNGTVPAVTDLRGWHTGRCFYSTSRSTPRNSLLAFITTDNPDSGPLFPISEITYVSLVYGSGLPANYFDHMSPEQLTEIENFILGLQRQGVNSPREENGSLVVNSTAGSVWSLRKNGPYLVTQVIGASGDTWYCYHFASISGHHP